MTQAQRESMQYDVVIVGGGPAGLSAAIKLQQLAQASNTPISVCLLEKGAELGAHILSGAVIEPRALDELLPDWKALGAPLNTAVNVDELHLFTSSQHSIKIPNLMIPPTMHNSGNYIVSLGNFVRWLGEQAEGLGVEIYPGFAAAEIIYHDNGSIKGVATPDMGVDVNGEKKESYEPGMELHAKYTIFAEGCRGQLGKELIEKFKLSENNDVQHYGLGFKELWEVPSAQHQLGKVQHFSGWPLTKGLFDKGTGGGGFLYHLEDNMVAVGLIIDLNYANPHLSPFDEFQRMKHHPEIAQVLHAGKRVSYGARAITKGGMNSLVKMHMAGALIVGCNAGTLNFAKIKGTHTAMKSGMVAAEELYQVLADSDQAESQDLAQFQSAFMASWAGKELYDARNFGPVLHKFGGVFGGAWSWLEQVVFRNKWPLTLHDKVADHETLMLASDSEIIPYPKPDGVLSFDKNSSIFLSNTYHQENIFCHLVLNSRNIIMDINFKKYAVPEQRYCPAGVYEMIEDDEGRPELAINSQNCIHCKTCDIKDPSQNITWIAPEGAGGPSYPNM